MCPPEYAEEVLAVAPAIAALYVRIVVADYVYHSRGAEFRLPVVSVPNEADTVAVPRLDSTEDDVTSLNWAKTAGGLNGIEEAGVSVVDDKGQIVDLAYVLDRYAVEEVLFHLLVAPRC